MQPFDKVEKMLPNGGPEEIWIYFVKGMIFNFWFGRFQSIDEMLPKQF